MSDADEKRMALIRVKVCDKHALSTILKTMPATSASDLCSLLSNKLDIPASEERFYSLILVHSVTSDQEHTRHALYTLKPGDLIHQTEERISLRHIAKYPGTTSPSPSSSSSSSSRPSPTGGYYRHNGDVEGENRVDGYDRSGSFGSNRGGGGNSGSRRLTTKWYYKDIRSAPLELDGDVSGDSSSDDEEEFSLGDFSYLKQGERKGYLYKRSSTDPNLWRSRWCVLGDKLWAFNLLKAVPKASQIQLNNSIRLSDRAPALNYPNSIVLNGPAETYFLRAPSCSEQLSWLMDLRTKVNTSAENDVMDMAELIICDEERTRVSRSQSSVLKLLHSSVAESVFRTEYDALSSVLSTGNAVDIPVHASSFTGRTESYNKSNSSSRSSLSSIAGNGNSDENLYSLLNISISPNTAYTSAFTAPSSSSSSIPREINSGSPNQPPNHRLSPNHTQPKASSPKSMTMTPQQQNPHRRTDSSSSARSSWTPPERLSEKSSSSSSLKLIEELLSVCHRRIPILGVVRGVRRSHPLLEETLGFLTAVQEYREMHRHDIRYPIAPSRQWNLALFIYERYLSAPFSSFQTQEGVEGEELRSLGSHRINELAQVLSCDGGRLDRHRLEIRVGSEAEVIAKEKGKCERERGNVFLEGKDENVEDGEVGKCRSDSSWGSSSTEEDELDLIATEEDELDLIATEEDELDLIATEEDELDLIATEEPQPSTWKTIERPKETVDEHAVPDPRGEDVDVGSVVKCALLEGVGNELSKKVDESSTGSENDVHKVSTDDIKDRTLFEDCQAHRLEANIDQSSEVSSENTNIDTGAADNNGETISPSMRSTATGPEERIEDDKIQTAAKESVDIDVSEKENIKSSQVFDIRLTTEVIQPESASCPEEEIQEEKGQRNIRRGFWPPSSTTTDPVRTEIFSSIRRPNLSAFSPVNRRIHQSNHTSLHPSSSSSSSSSSFIPLSSPLNVIEEVDIDDMDGYLDRERDRLRIAQGNSQYLVTGNRKGITGNNSDNRADNANGYAYGYGINWRAGDKGIVRASNSNSESSRSKSLGSTMGSFWSSWTSGLTSTASSSTASVSSSSSLSFFSEHDESPSGSQSGYNAGEEGSNNYHNTVSGSSVTQFSSVFGEGYIKGQDGQVYELVDERKRPSVYLFDEVIDEIEILLSSSSS